MSDCIFFETFGKNWLYSRYPFCIPPEYFDCDDYGNNDDYDEDCGNDDDDDDDGDDNDGDDDDGDDGDENDDYDDDDDGDETCAVQTLGLKRSQSPARSTSR